MKLCMYITLFFILGTSPLIPAADIADDLLEYGRQSGKDKSTKGKEEAVEKKTAIPTFTLPTPENEDEKIAATIIEFLKGFDELATVGLGITQGKESKTAIEKAKKDREQTERRAARASRDGSRRSYSSSGGRYRPSYRPSRPSSRGGYGGYGGGYGGRESSSRRRSPSYDYSAPSSRYQDRDESRDRSRSSRRRGTYDWDKDKDKDDTSEKRTGGYAPKKEDEKDTKTLKTRAANLQKTIITDLKNLQNYYDNFDGTNEDYAKAILAAPTISNIAKSFEEQAKALQDLKSDEQKKLRESSEWKSGQAAAFANAIPALVTAATYLPLDEKTPPTILQEQLKKFSHEQDAAQKILKMYLGSSFNEKIKEHAKAIDQEQEKKYTAAVDTNLAKVKTMLKNPTDPTLTTDEKNALNALGKIQQTLSVIAGNLQSIAPGYSPEKSVKLIQKIEGALPNNSADPSVPSKKPIVVVSPEDAEKGLIKVLKQLANDYKTATSDEKFVGPVLQDTTRIQDLVSNFSVVHQALATLKNPELKQLQDLVATHDTEYKAAIPVLILLAVIPIAAMDPEPTDKKTIEQNQVLLQQVVKALGAHDDYKKTVVAEITTLVNAQVKIYTPKLPTGTKKLKSTNLVKIKEVTDILVILNKLTDNLMASVQSPSSIQAELKPLYDLNAKFQAKLP